MCHYLERICPVVTCHLYDDSGYGLGSGTPQFPNGDIKNEGNDSTALKLGKSIT